jgi:hypothetical protein
LGRSSHGFCTGYAAYGHTPKKQTALFNFAFSHRFDPAEKLKKVLA